jgi:hypothetical protein
LEEFVLHLKDSTDENHSTVLILFAMPDLNKTA